MFRGCCLGLMVLAGLVAAAGYLTVRVLSRPELGASPVGARHGGTPEAIGAAIAVEAAAGLVSSPHTVVTLSERDLTVIARARNPLPARFDDPEARIREGLVVVSASSSLGPLSVTSVARLRLGVGGQGGGLRLVSEITTVEFGKLSIPDWARSALDPRGAATLSFDSVIDGSPALAAVRDNLDCLDVGTPGVRIGVHRPGVAASPGGCV